MITAENANKKTFESKKAKEGYYLEVLKRIESMIIKAAESGYFRLDLKTYFMYPFRDKVIEELVRNGYNVELQPPSGIFPEWILISWK